MDSASQTTPFNLNAFWDGHRGMPPDLILWLYNLCPIHCLWLNRFQGCTRICRGHAPLMAIVLIIFPHCSASPWAWRTKFIFKITHHFQTLCFYDYDELYDVVISAFLHDAHHLSIRKYKKLICFGQVFWTHIQCVKLTITTWVLSSIVKLRLVKMN